LACGVLHVELFEEARDDAERSRIPVLRGFQAADPY
jgi:hypothetical protein